MDAGRQRDLSCSVSDSPGADIQLHITEAAALVLAGICLIILSIGVVGALLLFVYLSFIYPASANVLIPVIFAPLAVLIFGNSKRVKAAITAGRLLSGAKKE